MGKKKKKLCYSVVLELRGKNAVKIQPTGRFRALHDIVNVEYLCPYNERER